MVIRDDRSQARPGSVLLLNAPSRMVDAHFAPDAVLHTCPDCGRDHFVTVDACPSEEQAAREAAMVVRRAA